MTAAGRATVFLLLAALPALPVLAQESGPYKGRLLSEVLQELQSSGLRIVFSSAIVQPDLRVSTEPRAKTARQRIEELLVPHGLSIREGPGGTLQVVRAAAPRKERQEKRGSLEGQVVDAWTGTPLPRVHVQVDGHLEDARTDAAGQFVIPQLAKGTRIVTASAAGYQQLRRTVTIDDGSTATVMMRLFLEARRYEEFVSVTDSAPPRTDRGVASEVSLERDDFDRLHGSVTVDPLRAVQTFPGVTAVDDFRSDIAVRGSPFRHVGLVVDGVSTPWLRHTAFGRGATGSLMMLSGLVVERATLRSGAFPRRHSDHLGSELDLALREGSRRSFGIRGAIGSGHAVLAAEGPLGNPGANEAARGSWLVSGRQSYLTWPPERSAASRTPFGFSDWLAKIAFDVRPTQRLTVTGIRGVSSIDEDEDHLVPNEPPEGINRTSAVILSWHSAMRPAFVVRQQLSLVAHESWNPGRNMQASDEYATHAYSYRAGLSRPTARGMLDVGGLVERMETSRTGDVVADNGSSWLQSGFAHFSWPATPSLTLSPGLRVTWSTLIPTPVVSRWLLGEWSFRPGWSLIGSAGTSRQLPELQHTLGEAYAGDLRSERAAHLEVGIEQELTSTIRWQATMFSRREADVIRSPDLHPRLVANTLAFPLPSERYTNALRGTSRGIELLVTRRSQSGLEGWATYAYGRTRQSDAAREETFWADFDRRHTFSMFAGYRISPATSIGTTFRAGSNFPLPGYFTGSNHHLLVGGARNQVRLPPYARLDLRADRRFRYGERSFTVFAEGLNVLNRTNVGLAEGSVDSATGAAIGFTDTLLSRRLSAGLVFEF
jgi:hypothetical protein